MAELLTVDARPTESKISVERHTADSLYSIMKTVHQTKCEVNRLELLKTSSDIIRNLSPVIDLNSESHGQLELNVLSPALEDAVQLAIPASFHDRGHFIFEREDFQSVTERTEIVLSFINSVLELCNRSGISNPNIMHGSLPHLLIVLSSNMRNCLWSRDSVQKLTLQVLNQLRILFKVDSLSELLQLDLKSKDKETATTSRCLLGQYLNAVRARLTKQKWQANPMFVESFVWMLTQMMKFPHLSDYLDIVLPPALLFADSHVPEQRVTGIQCLLHIAANVTNEQLRWYGRVDVVYAALKQQIYSREPEVIRVLHPALLTVLPVIDRNPGNPDPQHGPQQIDDILSIIITSAITENGLVLRRLHTQCIPEYIASLGLRSVRHLRKLIDLVSDYLEVCDAPEEQARFNALNILYALLQNAWPRIPSYADQILKSIMKLFQDLATRSSPTTKCVASKLSVKASSCLELLIEICPDVEACVQEVAQTPELKDVMRVHDLPKTTMFQNEAN